QGRALPTELHGLGAQMLRCRRADFMERVMGIEPTPSAWKAEVLPLNYTRRGGGGGGRIRTYEGISQQIYSRPRLAAWVPLRGHKEPGILFTKVLSVNSKLTIRTPLRPQVAAAGADNRTGCRRQTSKTASKPRSTSRAPRE